MLAFTVSPGTTLQNFNNELTGCGQATSDICTYFKHHMPGWQGENLKNIILPGGSRLVQYAHDLLLASTAYEGCLKDTICLCSALAEREGHPTPLSKL